MVEVDGLPKLKPRLVPPFVAAEAGDWPNRPANGFGCSFAGGVAAVISSDGAASSLCSAVDDPNLMGEPTFQVLSAAPTGLAALKTLVDLVSFELSEVDSGCGVVGLLPNNPSPGTGPSRS